MRNEKFATTLEIYSFFILIQKTATFSSSGLSYFPFGKASSESSLKKS